MQRCFLAFELDTETRQALQASVVPLKRASRDEKPRFVEASSYHVTLKFLGSVEAELLAALSASLRATLAGFEPVQCRWAGFGGLPRRAKAHVLVAVLGDDLGLSSRVHQTVEESCATLGFAEEARSFKPHTTVARFKAAVDVRRYLSLVRVPLGSVRLSSVALYQSTLAPGGARYTVLDRFPLARATAGLAEE